MINSFVQTLNLNIRSNSNINNFGLSSFLINLFALSHKYTSVLHNVSPIYYQNSMHCIHTLILKQKCTYNTTFSKRRQSRCFNIIVVNDVNPKSFPKKLANYANFQVSKKMTSTYFYYSTLYIRRNDVEFILIVFQYMIINCNLMNPKVSFFTFMLKGTLFFCWHETHFRSREKFACLILPKTF